MQSRRFRRSRSPSLSPIFRSPILRISSSSTSSRSPLCIRRSRSPIRVRISRSPLRIRRSRSPTRSPTRSPRIALPLSLNRRFENVSQTMFSPRIQRMNHNIHDWRTSGNVRSPMNSPRNRRPTLNITPPRFRESPQTPFESPQTPRFLPILRRW
jgi:hypothetical protein